MSNVCEENLTNCDNALNACEKAVESETAAHDSCIDLVEEHAKQVAEQAVRIKVLYKEANHSHVPHVASTSVFWILLLVLF